MTITNSPHRSRQSRPNRDYGNDLKVVESGWVWLRIELLTDPCKQLLEVGLGRQRVRLGERDPAQRRVGLLGPDRARAARGQDEPHVSMLVRGFAAAGRDRDDDHLPDRRVRPGDQVLERCLLTCLAQGDRERVGLAWIGVPADLKPSLLALV